jgi:Ca2+-binding EF-hand superfamily protein
VKSGKDRIANSTKEIEIQLQDVEVAEEENKKSTEQQEAKAAQDLITAAGVAHNPHTVLSTADLDVAFSQYQLFLVTKHEVLVKQIEHKKLRGVTPSQYAEIDRQFRKFDKDSNGKLERSEFRACLYSLGEELPKRRVQAIMDQYAGAENAERITFEQFKEFMITYFGVTDSREDILNAYKDIAGDEKSISINHIVPRRMEVFSTEDLRFFQSSAPKTEGRAESWDYVPFVDEVFSR